MAVGHADLPHHVGDQEQDLGKLPPALGNKNLNSMEQRHLEQTLQFLSGNARGPNGEVQENDAGKRHLRSVIQSMSRTHQNAGRAPFSFDLRHADMHMKVKITSRPGAADPQKDLPPANSSYITSYASYEDPR